MVKRTRAVIRTLSIVTRLDTQSPPTLQPPTSNPTKSREPCRAVRWSRQVQAPQQVRALGRVAHDVEIAATRLGIPDSVSTSLWRHRFAPSLEGVSVGVFEHTTKSSAANGPVAVSIRAFVPTRISRYRSLRFGLLRVQSTRTARGCPARAQSVFAQTPRNQSQNSTQVLTLGLAWAEPAWASARRTKSTRENPRPVLVGF